MGNHILKIVSISNLTHDVLRFTTNKAVGFDFELGQAANLAINRSGWLKRRKAIFLYEFANK